MPLTDLPIVAHVRHLLAQQAAPVSVEQVRAFLAAFASLRTDVNEGYSFELASLEPHGDLEAALATHFAHYEGAHWALAPLDDWASTVLAASERWLLPVGPQPWDALGIAGGPGCEEHGPAWLIALLHALLNGEAQRGFALEVRTRDWYEAAWEDFVLVSSSAAFLLHLGVSD